MAKDSHLRNYFEVHLALTKFSFQFNQKPLQKFSGWTFTFFFFAFELYYSLFHMVVIKSSYRVDQALFNFYVHSFEIL